MQISSLTKNFANILFWVLINYIEKHMLKMRKAYSNHLTVSNIYSSCYSFIELPELNDAKCNLVLF